MSQRQAASGAATSSGLDPRVAAVIAYSGWWATGGLFLVVERSDESVRFHAAQSVVAFGAISLLIGAAYTVALPLLLVSGPAGRTAVGIANAAWLAGVGLWAWLIVKAARGEQWCVPGLGTAIRRLARLSG
jgi:uncharacterized membrane protein